MCNWQIFSELFTLWQSCEGEQCLWILHSAQWTVLVSSEHSAGDSRVRVRLRSAPEPPLRPRSSSGDKSDGHPVNPPSSSYQSYYRGNFFKIIDGLVEVNQSSYIFTVNVIMKFTMQYWWTQSQNPSVLPGRIISSVKRSRRCLQTLFLFYLCKDCESGFGSMMTVAL